jgi:hypothetical protein
MEGGDLSGTVQYVDICSWSPVAYRMGSGGGDGDTEMQTLHTNQGPAYSSLQDT